MMRPLNTRLSAFRLPFSFFFLVIASEAEEKEDCFIAPLLAMTPISWAV
jgi:hypothetical protein